MEQESSQQLLREGISLARSPEGRDQARNCLREAVALDPGNESAWMWLAGLAKTPDEALPALEQVLTLNPTHEKARAAARAARLQSGIQAARARDKARARAYLICGGSAPTTPTTRWPGCGWPASPRRWPRASPLSNGCSRWNPANEQARASLARHQAQSANRPSTAPPSDPLALEPLDEPREGAGRLERNAAEGKAPLALACPFCGAWTEDGDEGCPGCGALLVLDPISSFEARTPRDTGRLLAFIAEVDGSDQRQDFEGCIQLALAQLNLRRFEAARTALKQALLLRPDVERLRTAVEDLTRLCEEKARDGASGPRRTVLVVDDDPTICKLVSLTLEAHGYGGARPATATRPWTSSASMACRTWSCWTSRCRAWTATSLCKLLRQNPDTARLPLGYADWQRWAIQQDARQHGRVQRVAGQALRGHEPGPRRRAPLPAGPLRLVEGLTGKGERRGVSPPVVDWNHGRADAPRNNPTSRPSLSP